jgi:methionine sulfoxide reductase catalytic subunit
MGMAMLIKKPGEIRSGEITPKDLYLSRRTLLRGAALAATAAGTAWVYRRFATPPAVASKGEAIAGLQPAAQDGYRPPADPPTSLESITHYNNFYEFSTDKRAVAYQAKDLLLRPWTVAVDGLAHRPKVFDLDDLLKLHRPEERVYRMRCVEGWSMVIPWVGLPLRRLLEQVQPMASARYVAFESLADPRQMPNVHTNLLHWPYAEGLRLDEAMHPLTLLAVGLYGQTLLPQNGAPLRLVVPWKYGFKGAKSIVRIRLLEDRPATAWNRENPQEYGFYSNVNPNVDHPRWSQRTEQRIGEHGRRETLMFNGYQDQVGSLYAGMDLRLDF